MFELISDKLLKNIIILMLSVNVFYFVWAAINRYTYTPPPVTDEGVSGIKLLPLSAKSPKKRKLSNCYTVGPFSTKKAANYMLTKINYYGLATVLKKQRTKQTLDYMVYLKPLPSRREAENVVNTIKKQAIKDYMIINSGPYKNAIALGSFDDLDKARRHSEYIKFLGYDARYTAQRKPKEIFWLEYDEPIGVSAPVLQWAKEIDQKANVQKIAVVCKY